MAKRATPNTVVTTTTAVNLFDKAPVIVRGAKKTGTKREHAIPGLRDEKACRRMRAVIAVVEKQIDTEQVKNAMNNIFLGEGCESAIRPENFVGTDGPQTASCQLKVRSFGPNGIDLDVADEINEMGLGHLIEINETFMFDQTLLTPDVMTTIIQALGQVNLPEGIIVKQQKRSLRANAVETLFATKGKDRQFMKAALPLFTQLATRCDFDKEDANFRPDAERVIELLGLPKFADVITEAARDPEKVLNPPREKKPARKKAA